MRLLALLFFALFFASCEKKPSFNRNAHLNGQIINPSSKYVSLYQQNKLLDTIPLDEKGKFSYVFDSLDLGLIQFEHLPERQMMVLEAGDSISLRANMSDFDASLVFSGTGSAKNNFLTNILLDLDYERNFLANKYVLNSSAFRTLIDSLFLEKKKKWQAFSNQKKFSPLVKTITEATYTYPYINRLERYTLIRGKAAVKNDSNYFTFRKPVDFNSKALTFYEPYITYLMSYLSVEALNESESFNKKKKTTAYNLNRLALIDENIQDEKLRNSLSRSVAYEELLNFENHELHDDFIASFNGINTNADDREEVLNFHYALLKMKKGQQLPIVQLETHKNTLIPSNFAFSGQKTVLYFWSQTQMNHFKRTQERVKNYQEKYPDYRFVGISIQPYNDMVREYQDIMQINVDDQYALVNFESASSTWVITHLNKAIVLDENGNLINGFDNFASKTFLSEIEK